MQIYGFEVYTQCPDDCWHEEVDSPLTNVAQVVTVEIPSLGQLYIKLIVPDKDEVPDMALALFQHMLKDDEFVRGLLAPAFALKAFAMGALDDEEC